MASDEPDPVAVPALLERLADLVAYGGSLSYIPPMKTADVPSKELDMEEPCG